MPLSAQEICELISKRNGDSIRKIEETAGLGKDSLRTAISRGASLSSKSEEKILEAYSFLNPTYIRIGEGEPYIGSITSGTFVPKKPSFEAKYVALLEEVVEERKRNNDSVFEKLNEIVVFQREKSASIIQKIEEIDAHQKELAKAREANSHAMQEEYKAILDRVIGIETVLGKLGTTVKSIQNSLSVGKKDKV